MAQYYKHYRHSTVGWMLEDSLEDLLNNETLTDDQAELVRRQFDKSFSTAMTANVKTKGNLKGKLHIYRNCDNVWTFFLRRASIKWDSTEPVEIDSFLRIYAPDSRQQASNKAQ